jgi:hypothetical protein
MKIEILRKIPAKRQDEVSVLAPALLIVELNEFNPDLLARMSERLGLKNIQIALGFRHSTSTTDDRIEHQGLDPWVQWVGIHSGKPTCEHGIRRLGLTGIQTSPQIWNAVADRGYSWGVWGVMNAPLGHRGGCRFFMPDPWSFEEVPYPDFLNDLLALPRYAARNYLEMDRKQVFVAALRLARFFAPPKHWGLLLRFSECAARSMYATGPSVHALASLLDYLSVLYFIRLRREHRPNLSMIFLNHIAHLQHQFWRAGEELHAEMKLGLELCDSILGMLLADRQACEGFILMNGLKQKNVEGQGFFVYRQLDPQAAVESIGVTGGRVEQNMTHDATILFTTTAQADCAVKLLNECRLSDGSKAFFVERQASNRVFYQLAFEHKVMPDVMLICGNFSQRFHDAFQLVCERTGAHVPEGDIYSDGIAVPCSIKNHETYEHVLAHFERRIAIPVGS